jgi:glyoxylase-like metal-dependent hydrolase (beta-lactamase superfamily II)
MKSYRFRINVITSSPEGFWSDATLLEGEKETLLIDTCFTLSDAHKLAAAILENKKKLSTIYVTHFHPDHFFGLTVLKQAFPGARIVALPETVAEISTTWEADVKNWKPAYGDNIPTSPVIPDVLTENALTLEDEKFEIVGKMQGDARNNAYVWMPELQTVVCGDIAFNGVYPWTLETTAAERKDWIRSIEKIVSLRPAVVIAGHKRPDLKNSPACLTFTQNYLKFFDEALLASKTGEDFKRKVKSKFPGLGLDAILQMACDAAFPTEKKAA